MRIGLKLLTAALVSTFAAWGPGAQASEREVHAELANGLKSFVEAPAPQRLVNLLRDKEAHQRVLWSLEANAVDQRIMPMLFRMLNHPEAIDFSDRFFAMFSREGAGRSAENEILEFEANTRGFVQASALSSVPRILDMHTSVLGYRPSAVSMVSVNILDRKMNRLGGAINVQFGAGENNVATTPWVPLPGHTIEEGAAIAHAVFLVGDFDGHVAVAEAYQVLHVGYPKSIHNQAPIAREDRDEIILCIDRAMGDEHDCTYGPTHDPQRRIIFPLKGRVTLNAPVRTLKSGKPIVTISAELLPESGGSCRLTFPLAANIITANANRDLVWDIPEANFGQSCFGQGERMAFRLEFDATTEAGVEVARITNVAGYRPSPSTVMLPAMQVQYGCVAVGSLVTMADGSTKPIEQVANGDRVLSRPQGPVLAVRGTVAGEEPAMIGISTEDGHSVQVTATHPMVTAKGAIMASAVKEGDVLLTADGTAKVTGVQPKPAARVYNLQVGAGDDGVVPPAGQTTFIANGIVVGDLVMQRAGELVERDRPDRVAEALRNSIYSRDYENWMKRTAR